MTIETATYINQLDTTLPTAADLISEGDDHIRLLKAALKTTFPNVAGVVLLSHTQINAIADKASRTGDTYTGAHNFTGASVAVATAAGGDASSKPASTAFVAAAALSTSLPGQAGNAGKFLRTDGSNATWQTGANQFDEPAVPLAGSGTLDLSLGGRFTDTVAASRTFTVANAATGSVFTLEIYKTGGTVTLPTGSVWANGVPADLANGKRHMLYFQRTQVGTPGWYVSSITGYAA